MQGRSKDVEVLEDRQPKTLDPTAGDGSTCRDVLVTWMQAGLEPAARKVIARSRKLARSKASPRV